ncbi:MAG: SAM-dependent methyltransferase, partial [Hyphomicrobium sp.]
HRSTPYRFDHTDPSDWIAQHFFTGGLMPSRLLMYEFGDRFEVDVEWWWNGSHYARTADAWLANFDRNAAAVRRVLTPVYGSDTNLWMRRWRLFFLATSGLFGHANGNEWGVSHYLLKPAG